ncbi:uncharacterized protein FIBRA_00403 [Fibroporia radiculosa]|uniref:SET domain-containing protein n=1 Tax=Fibroporia radiculosa TaxID=599839 RepID=J4I7X2_9APHY|nr:uncharacterized protein FIBRA_00403 [Fibroporia radiculosa]CCL98406.1 predicted protein [Fibroporia radiculosa]
MENNDNEGVLPCRSPPKLPDHLNSSGCRIGHSEGKGRGVFASRPIAADVVIEISPVLLFSSTEYARHGQYTVLDSYTFKWRDGRMALALGLGSLFNHSQTPNVSYILDSTTESIRYVTTRPIEQEEELCIFYGHKLWFDAVDGEPLELSENALNDGWDGLCPVGGDVNGFEDELQRFTEGCLDELVQEESLPFVRMKVVVDDNEDTVETVQTGEAWVVDIPDPKQTTAMLRWLKQSGLETPSMAHLKRIRRQDSTMSLLLAYTLNTADPPLLPPDVMLPPPYILSVPLSVALTPAALKAKSTFWPTVYAPRRKGEVEEWSKGKVRWACEAMSRVILEAQQAQQRGDLPIAAHVPISYDEEARTASQLNVSLVASDTRASSSHPLRHAILNVIRAVAEYRASSPERTVVSEPQTPLLPNASPPSGAPMLPDTNSDPIQARNGTHYLLTSLTLFTTHEPCVMCSMALLHSRVKEIFYLIPMKATGGCGSVACVPRLDGVNHRFGIRVWRTGEGEKECDLAVDPATDA